MENQFRPMRRQDRALSDAEAREMLGRVKWGTLSLAQDDGGWPHAVPVNCAYVDGALLFHCGREGKKLEILDRDGRACFSAVVSHLLVPERLTAHFESVMCYGRVRRVPDDEKVEALSAFTAAVFDWPVEKARAKIVGCALPTVVLRMGIEHLSGKRSRG